MKFRKFTLFLRCFGNVQNFELLYGDLGMYSFQIEHPYLYVAIDEGIWTLEMSTFENKQVK